MTLEPESSSTQQPHTKTAQNTHFDGLSGSEILPETAETATKEPQFAAIPGIIILPLTRGQYAVVDAADEQVVGRHPWSAKQTHGKWYATTGRGRETQFLHRLLMNAGAGELIDHRDGDGLNCRRSNLRRCTNAENIRNQRPKAGRFKGVKACRTRWRACITADGVRYNLGSFATAEEAARAYDAAAVRLHGEFACLNFSDTQLTSGAAYGQTVRHPLIPLCAGGGR